MIDALPLAVLCVALLVATVSQRVAGMGFGLVMGPTAALLVGPIAAVVLVNVTAIVACGLILPRVWRDIDWRRLAWIGIPAAIASIGGLLLARVVSADLLRIAVGAVAILGVVLALAFTRTEHRLDGPVTRLVAGSTIGVLNASVAVGAPAVGVYQIVSRWEPRAFAATMQPFWVLVSASTLLERQLLVPQGWPEWPWWAWLAVVAATAAGTLVAEPIARRLPARAVRIAIVVLSILGGGAVIVAGAIGLAG